MPQLSFPEGFVWGAATASYQIEGATKEDGRGASIWDTFSAIPDKTKNGETGARTCDHYHLYEEDVALMAGLGLSAYRFSIAWPRVMPSGTGAVNHKGLIFYDRLIEALLDAGIEPWICLYHWDLPQALEDKGGWTNRDCAKWFADYARVVAERFADRVAQWATFNEPSVFTLLGYGIGYHAPGRADRTDWLKAVHHVNVAHGTTLETLRATMPTAQVGVILNMQPVRGEQAGRDDKARETLDAIWNRAFIDPMVTGEYPAPIADCMSRVPGLVQQGDLDIIRQRMDWFGLNHYSPIYAKADASPWGVTVGAPPAGRPLTGMGWEIDPAAFRDQITELAERYWKGPIYITENGFGQIENAPPGGAKVDDKDRIAYIASYLQALLEARARGADVRGYFVWSLMDNFEWAEGFEKRFGLVRVDYDALKRTPKASYDWYKRLVTGNALP
ncbi:MAG: GH1 family beta-glucosidase [Alphaproteobacteria bacterium]